MGIKQEVAEILSEVAGLMERDGKFFCGVDKEYTEKIVSLVRAGMQREIGGWLEKNNVIAINKKKSLNELGWLITMEKLHEFLSGTYKEEEG